MEKIILLLDNALDFLEVHSKLLEQVGYRVLRAFTLEDARKKLSEQHIHLAILDMRILDENDEQDISGLLLAQQEEYKPIPKIILTGYPSYEIVREALGLAPDGQPPAVNFLYKGEGLGALIQAVEEAFAQFVRINWNLNIQWDTRERLSFFHLAGLIQPGLPNDTLIQRAEELEDLVRRLFYDYQWIRIGRLLWDADKRFCLPILASSSEGTTDSSILVCGERELLEQEWAQMKEMAPEVLRGTELRSQAETMHLGANLYGLPGADIEIVQTLRDLSQVGKEQPLKTAFTHLLGDVLKAWHQHGQMVQKTRDLMSLYRQWAGLTESCRSRTEVEQRVGSLVQLTRRLEAVEIKRNNEQITFHFPHQSPLRYPDPVATVYAPLTKYNMPVVCRISPGRLTVDNVLVDEKQNTWLIDFALAGQAPQWWDYVCLEAAIRFDLSQATDLLAWQDFEECLVKPSQLDEGLKQSDVIPELRTGVALIEQIRRQAGSEAGPEVLPYYAGLLAWAVEAMARYDPRVIYTQADRLRGAHLLLAAAMITERLGTVTDNPPPKGPLRLDEEGKVWIGDHCVTVLIGSQLKLLRCLYDQTGKAVSSRTIVETVYGEQYDALDHDNQDQRIRLEVCRLREEIEPEPNSPRYILAERGRGYCLHIRGEPEE